MSEYSPLRSISARSRLSWGGRTTDTILAGCRGGGDGNCEIEGGDENCEIGGGEVVCRSGNVVKCGLSCMGMFMEGTPGGMMKIVSGRK